MNDEKICFITCVNDEEKYRESLYYISHLVVPYGFEIECVAIRNAASMAEGYNRAMMSSDAKYKVYLHQDLFILNNNFISDVVSLFHSDEKIGLIGVIGAIKLPSNATWWDTPIGYGKAYDNYKKEMSLLVYKESKDDFEEVQAVDGLIYITQYDLPHRSDLFNGWHFYDISQCVEFKRHGYKVIVPTQSSPWCLHDCGNGRDDGAYEYYRQKFIKEYSADVFPLVSVLIPTYNRPELFEIALRSAINQTYRNIEIIVGDDSTDYRTEDLMHSKYLKKYKNIQYYHNENNLGQFDNDLKLMSGANGEYVNFLMDDDLFNENKIEKMMNCFIADINDELSLVTSHRALIDENNNFLEIFGDTDKVIKGNSVISGNDLANYMLTNNYNLIGEPTTVLFKKSRLKVPFGTFDGRRYYCNVDQATWLELLSEGNAFFVNEPLSCFRWHKDQQLKSPKAILGGAADYAHSVITCKSHKKLLNGEKYEAALNKCYSYMNSILNQFSSCSIDKDSHILYDECLEWKEKLINELSPINRESNALPHMHFEFSQNETEYSDGSIENDLLRIARNFSNYDEVIKSDRRWPVLYHFSRLRQNIINWYPFRKDATVLEVGSGCGAITGALCGMVQHVYSAELTKQRSMINYARNSKHDNLDFYVGDIFKMSFDQKFDYITLIGVLEYAALMSDSANPYENLLKKLRSMLKDDGHILIAIENRFGLKYFSGAREDHTGMFYEGIKGYPHNGKARTFTKSEIEELLHGMGINEFRFYYPMPDYKFPKCIYTDETINSFNEFLNFDSLDNDRISLFDEYTTMTQLAKEGVLGTFSNSFFIDIGPVDRNIVMAKINTERKREFQIFTYIEQKDNNRVAIKRPVSIESNPHINNILSNYSNSTVINGYELAKCKAVNGGVEFEYVEGKTLAQLLSDALSTNNMGKLCKVLDEYYDHLFSNTVLKDDFYSSAFVKMFGDCKYNGALYCSNPCNMDISFYNIIKTDGGYKCIDYEWIVNFPLPVEYVFWRGLITFQEFSKDINQLNEIIKRYGITGDMAQAFSQWEKHFLDSVADANIVTFAKRNIRFSFPDKLQ